MEPFDIEKRGNFEEAFSLAFDGAEITPDPRVWDRLDANLAKDQNSSFKKRLFILQLVAAASLIFAATVTLFQVFKGDTSSPISGELLSEQSGEVQEKKSPENMEKILPLAGSDDTEETVTSNDPLLTDESESKTIPTTADVKIDKNPPILTEVEINEKRIGTDVQALESYQAYTVGVESRDYNIQTGLTRFEPLFVPVWTKKIEEDDLNMWASAGFAAGSYNPSSGGLGLGVAAADEAAVPNDQLNSGSDQVFSDEQSGRSVGGGIGFGSRIGRKWILESGINYLHSEIDGTTNSFIETNGRSIPVYYDTKFTGTLNNVSSFGITNSLDFITVPLKAGYIIIDRKIGWVATGGIGSNILLGNRLTSDLGQLESVSYAVSDSPYRRMSLSGIIGTEVYLNITKNYQLMVVPQYNFGITEITKQESSFSIVPNSFNLGLKFRYLLK